VFRNAPATIIMTYGANVNAHDPNTLPVVRVNVACERRAMGKRLEKAC
jgi:hypothetical protein